MCSAEMKNSVSTISIFIKSREKGVNTKEHIHNNAYKFKILRLYTLTH